LGNRANARHEADGLGLAVLGARGADSRVTGQTAFSDVSMQRPWACRALAQQGRIPARSYTLAAECARSAVKVDGRISAASGSQQVLRAGVDAVAATTAPIGEQRFRQRPRRSHRRALAANITAQELSSTN